MQESRGPLQQLVILHIQDRRAAPGLILLPEKLCRLLRALHFLRIRIQEQPGNPEIVRMLPVLPRQTPDHIPGDAVGCFLILPVPFLRLAAPGTQNRQIHAVGINQIILEIELHRRENRLLPVQSGQPPVQCLQLPYGILLLMDREQVMNPVQRGHGVAPVAVL